MTPPGNFCAGQPITEIEVRTEPPYPEGVMRRVAMLAAAVQSLHVTTAPSVVRRFLAFEEGQPCSPLRLAESERILRAQPFLADAEIRAEPDTGGGVRVRVRTGDEFSLIVAASANQESPYLTRLRLGDGNLAGRGAMGYGEWSHGGPFFRDGWAGAFTHYQLFSRPYSISVRGARRELGSSWAAEALHPFFTDLQRVAWRISGSASNEYFSFERERADAAVLRVERRHFDIGGLIRIGVPGRLSLFGASLSRDVVDSGDDPMVLTETGLQPGDASTDVLLGRYRSHKTARVNALWGVRNIQFERVRGFDALTGVQDIRTGFQLGTLFGRSLSVIGSEDDDIFVSADLYMGRGNRSVYAALQVQGEGRQNFENDQWDGILASGRGALYVKPHWKHTVELSGEFSGGWHQRHPFQLRLGQPDGGVRGYRESRTGGGQRIVARIEERAFIGRPRDVGDLGLAAFFDAGRLWAGDVPFGSDTPIRFGAGVGILAAVPPRAKRLWRIDLAFPLSDDPHAQWEIRFSSRDHSRVFWREPVDVRRNREGSVRFSVFNWPR